MPIVFAVGAIKNPLGVPPADFGYASTIGFTMRVDWRIKVHSAVWPFELVPMIFTSPS